MIFCQRCVEHNKHINLYNHNYKHARKHDNTRYYIFLKEGLVGKGKIFKRKENDNTIKSDLW